MFFSVSVPSGLPATQICNRPGAVRVLRDLVDRPMAPNRRRCRSPLTPSRCHCLAPPVSVLLAALPMIVSLPEPPIAFSISEAGLLL